MKILHCCLAAFYIDGYGYQENILPKMHKLQGHDVKIIASTETYVDNKKLGYVDPKNYLNEDGIPVSRIPYNNNLLLPSKIVRKLRLYKNLKEELIEFMPDVIFLHDTQFLSIKEIIIYVKENPQVKIFSDCHTDYLNSARTWLSKNILHKIIYRYCTYIVEPYTTQFYGTLPIRNLFLEKVYKIPKEKISLLELGADDSSYDFSNKETIRKRVRKDLKIKNDEFVIITGGKLDRRKNIHLLMEAVSQLSGKKIKMIVFGIPNDEMENEINKLAERENILFLGWLTPEKVYEYLFAADLAFFPGTHSVAWEQSVGVGLPAVFKKWENIQHVDVGGNCLFLNDINIDELKKIILKIASNDELYLKMKNVAMTKGVRQFTYSEIAKRAISIRKD